MSQENAEIVLGLSEANARRDWDAVFDAHDPDIEWEDCSAVWRDWGVAKGHEGLRKAWRRWFEALGDVSWQLDGAPIDAGNDVTGTYRVHERGRGSGVQVAQRSTLIWSVRDGKIARVRVYRARRSPRSRGAAGVAAIQGQRNPSHSRLAFTEALEMAP